MKFKVKATITYEIERPDDWDEHLLDFQLNEGSWCGDNAIRDIELYLKDSEQCLCNIATFEVIE